MQTWSAVDVPALPSIGLPLRLRDSATGEIRPTSPGRTARIYVCGITPYDATHMGHAATYLAFDIVNRLWRDSGHEVHYVQNITDVDDPLLERALVTGQDWTEIAAREIALFKTDMEALRVLPPRHYIGAVESIPLVIEYITALQAAGSVYEVDGDLYFSVSADKHFGGVSHLGAAEMLPIFAERGGDPERPGKADPLDCLLWLRERPGEPSWDSPFGRGRPGWHIECVAIALHHLGMGFDVQGGGSDLVFPHHEMGSAQAHVATGQWPFARHFVHAGMVAYEGHKMSKSRGNLVFVSKLREAGIDPMAIRLALLAHHYRSDWEWTDADLRSAEERLAIWRQAAWADHGPDAHALLERVRERLTDDLDTPAALAAIDHWASEAALRPGSSTEAPELVRQMCDALLGVLL